MDKTGDIPEWMLESPVSDFPFRNEDEMEWTPQTTNGDAGSRGLYSLPIFGWAWSGDAQDVEN